jgi:hypothetical protein
MSNHIAKTDLVCDIQEGVTGYIVTVDNNVPEDVPVEQCWEKDGEVYLTDPGNADYTGHRVYDLTKLSHGPHTLWVRANGGDWGLSEPVPFDVTKPNLTPPKNLHRA